MGYTKPALCPQIFTDDDIRTLLESIEARAVAIGILGLRSILREEAKVLGIEILGKDDVFESPRGFESCADATGQMCGKEDCLYCGCPF